MALTSLTPDLFGEVRGEHPRVLALHGWGRDRTDFDAVLAGIDSISLDLPGFGASPPPPEGWGAADYAEAVAEVLGRFEAPPVVLGHSFGGRVAVCLAAAGHPLAGLVLAGVPLLRRQPPGKPDFAYRVVRWARRAGLVSEVRLERARQKHGSADYRATSGVMREVLVRVVNETYADELRSVGVPVRLVWGSDDQAAGAWIVEAALALLPPGSTAHVEPGVGHDIHLSRPDLIREAIATFGVTT